MATTSPGYARLLRNRRFTRAAISIALGDGGYSVYAIAILWLSLQLSGNPAVTGLVLFVELGVYSLTFIAGPTIDRVRDLRSVLVVGYSLQAILAFTIGATLSAGLLSVPLLLVLVAAISLIWDFTWTADNSLIPRIVSDEDLFRANGIKGALSGGNAIAGYAAGAGLILFVGPGDAMFLYAGLQVAALVAILPLSVPSGRAVTTPALADFWDGWRELGRGPGRPLLQLAIFSGFQGFFVAAAPLLVTVLSRDRFADPTTSYGILFTAYAVGGVIGGLLLGRWNPRHRLVLAMSGGTASTGLFLVAAAVAAPLLLPSVALWFLVGLTGVAFYSAFLVYLQASVPSDRFGRVLTNVYLFRGVPSAVGAAAIGFLATVLGPTNVAIFTALAWMVIAVAGPALLPAMKGLRF